MFDGHVKVASREPKLGVLTKMEVTICEDDFNLKHSSINYTFRAYMF